MEAPVPMPKAADVVAQKIIGNVERVLRGKREVVELAVAALLAKGHLLIEDVPGVGKTTLARALARSVGVSFQRVQFTSDLMPADVLGGNVYNQSTGEFTFRKGPIFTNVLLSDEINRTTPKTQSALLEAMDERQVSLDGKTHLLEEPFFVIATQNPEEFFGTYPLPESQLDRFIMRLKIGYPPVEIEREVISQRKSADPFESLLPVVGRVDLLAAQKAVDRIHSNGEVVDYVHAIVLATRSTPVLAIGASTRAALALERTARAFALVQGRSYATPDDVKAIAVGVLAHRVRVTGMRDGIAARGDAENVIREVLSTLPIPI
ncbi:MAG: MoxR family ATPase [Deltaproteobacteria bacterium]|nr:MoxR family ATPase [Deltaproteobacteria bacterium]